MSEWKPIETAPETGDAILLSDADGSIFIGTRKLFFEKSREYEIARATIDGVTHTWSAVPTHWQPLPEPPK